MNEIVLFWIIFLVMFAVLFAFKLYMRRGYRQALGPKHRKWANTLWIFSLSTLIIGDLTMIIAYSDGIINMSFGVNFVVALMMSVLICEFFLTIFFLSDDIALLFKKIRKVWKRKSDAVPEVDQGRRRFLKTTGLALSALPFSSFLWGITAGKYRFRVEEQVLYFNDLPEAFDGFRIVQISDIHSGSFDDFESVKHGIEMINQQAGDLILFTGDLVNDLADEIVPYKDLFAQLSAPFGKYSVLGNHDYAQDPNLFKTEETKAENLKKLKGHHADMGFKLMNNTSTELRRNGESIRLAGVENWGHGPFTQRGDLDMAFSGMNSDDFTVLMSHDPSHWDEKVLPHDKNVNLTLSGHTHGMQMGIELSFLKWSPVQYFYPRWAGLYKEDEQYLYVNRGFGFIGFAGRVGIPPEITVLELRKSAT